MKPSRTDAYVPKTLFIFSVLLSVLTLPGQAVACEPMYPFLIRFVFPSSMAGSLFGLIAGVLVKCALFAFLVRQISWLRAACFMFIANIITSLFGLVLIGASNFPFGLIFIPLACYMAMLPSKSLRKRMGEQLPDWLSPKAVAAFLFLALPLNGILFHGADSVSKYTGTYWLMKLVYIYAGLAVGIGMTTLWEEWLVFSFAQLKTKTNFLPAVLRTNLYTFLVLAFIGAAFAIPQRLSHPGFLLPDY